MTKIKYSALVTGMSGKLNGSVASRNRGGSYLRNKTTPLNPRTSFQARVRSFFAFVSSSWRNLTGAQVATWNENANDFPYTDYWGDTRTLSGFNLHQKLNTNLMTIGEAPILVPPAPVGVASVTAITAVIKTTPMVMSLDLDTVGLPALTKAVVFATRPIPVSRTFVKNDFRIIHIASDPTASIDVWADYTSRYGIPAAGLIVHFMVVLIDKTRGLASVGFVSSQKVASV